MRFASRALIASTIALFALALGLAVVRGFSVVMLFFGAVLLAVFLRGLADLADRYTPLSARLSVGLVLLVFVAAAALLGIFAAPVVAERVADVAERVPDAAAGAWEKLRSSGVGQYLPEKPINGGETLTAHQIRDSLSAIMGTAFGALANLAVVLIVGVYLALSPARYARGALHLVPQDHRERAGEVLDALSSSLGWWLVGRLASMAIVGVGSAVGLALLGVPLPWTLGALTGLLCFVPFVGPLLALAPPLLFAWVESGSLALAVLALYAVVQVLESYVITPLIQQRTVLLPAALVIGSQTVIGFAAGPVGVMLAVPLAVVVMVLVRELYVKGILGDDMSEAPEGAG